MTSLLGRYAALYAHHRLKLAVFLGLAIVQFLAAAPVPFVVKAVFDRAIGEGRLGLLIGLSVLILSLQLLTSTVGLVSSNWLLRVSTQVIRELRQNVFDKLNALSIAFHESNAIGDVHDRVVHETERVDAMTRNGFAVAIPAIVFTSGILGVLVFINWTLSLVTVAFLPIVYAVNRVSRTVLRRASRNLHGAVEEFSASTFRSLRTVRQTRILGVEPQSRMEQDTVLANAAEAAHRQGLMQRSHLVANRMVIAAWVIVVLAVGGAAVIDGRLTLGELFSFYAGLALIRQPIDQLVFSVPSIVAGQEALGRVFSLLDTEDPRPYTGEKMLTIEGDLSVQQVTFAYHDEDPVLIDVSLDVRPGEIVALIGPNGSGKTTLADLILGFYRPAVGRISMDGVDYRDIDIRHLRRQFGVLTQDPIMVPGTVRENITYGRPAVTEVELSSALELAGAGSLIDQLEAGLETRAYENGPLLSGGQLQRVALARALLGHPRLLILDEPTTHLDLEGVEALLHGLRALEAAPAMILITHKQEVAAMADSLYRMENGRLMRSVKSRFNRPSSDRDATSA